MNKILIFLALINFAAAQQLLNVSYDATRELFKEYNALFIKYYEQKSGKKIKILQSHGGSGAQARMLIDGLKADVATLALAYDINAVARKSGALDASWQEEFPLNSAPYNSTIVFLVRKGNPKGIKDWDDLVRNDVKIVTPNPKTSGGARYNHLAAYAYAAAKFNGDEDKIREFLVKLYANAPVLDAGARGSANTFIRRGIGDAMIAWENEAYLSKARLGENEFEIIYPSLSILAQPPVAVLSKNAAANGAKEVVRLEVRIGRLSGVEPHYLESAFEVYKTGTICENAELLIALQNVAVECKSCGFSGELSENDFTCPACGSQELEVTGGEDMHLMRLEMR